MLQALMSNNYACLQAFVNKAITWQSSCVIANNVKKQQKLFVQGYNRKVHNVVSCHCNYITFKPGFCVT